MRCHDEKTPLKFFAFFFFEKLLRSPAAIIIIDYCAVICIIDPRQKVKRFISEIDYFKNCVYPQVLEVFVRKKRRPPEGMSSDLLM